MNIIIIKVIFFRVYGEIQEKFKKLNKFIRCGLFFIIICCDWGCDL